MPVLLAVCAYFFWTPMLALFSAEGVHTKFPYFLFILLAISLTVLSFVKKLSLIPVLGLLSCFYLMAELEYESWIRFLGWLVAGLVIYFGYSYRNSKIGKDESMAR
jgi:APA family basic amino acid/polyamine antiporter